jgi:hypothetical protein
MIRVHHLNIIATKADRDELDRVGWTGKFAVHATITAGGEKAPDLAAVAFSEGAYKHVADVDLDDLEDAFRLTNHIHSVWNENTDAHVEPQPGPQRSTSVGDIIERDGEFFLVAPFGFETITQLGR